MKNRVKYIFFRRGKFYRVIFYDKQEQVEIIWLFSNDMFINQKKRAIQQAFNLRNLELELVAEAARSVIYHCHKELQERVLRAIANS